MEERKYLSINELRDMEGTISLPTILQNTLISHPIFYLCDFQSFASWVIFYPILFPKFSIFFHNFPSFVIFRRIITPLSDYIVDVRTK